MTDTLDEGNGTREIGGLVDAAKQFDLKRGVILTRSQEDEFQKDGVKIKVVPIWKWLQDSATNF